MSNTNQYKSNKTLSQAKNKASIVVTTLIISYNFFLKIVNKIFHLKYTNFVLKLVTGIL